jgi:O-antigen/teichoic acid export membrane protein
LDNQGSYTNRIAKNSLLLYFRMILVTVLNLFTLRLVLAGLGIKDYGIYDVVAGLITIVMSFSTALSSSILRYYAVNMDKSKIIDFRKIYSASLIVYISLSLIIVLLGESIGVWILNNYLVIPSDRIAAANWVFQFSIFSFIFTSLHTPFSSAILAFENIKPFTIISIIESVFKLVAAFFLSITKTDTLYFYGFYLLGISILIFLIYFFYSKNKYQENLAFLLPDLITIKQLLSFSGWSLFGSTASVGIIQVVTILINLFFGPIVNSARAISLQFNMIISSFTASFIMGLKTPMIKSYAEGSYSELDYMFYLSNKVIYYSLLIFCLPVIFEMDTILRIWLNVNNEQVVLFSKLMVVYSVIMALNNPISIIIQAIGKVKEYHLLVEFFMLLVVPFTYLFFYLGFPAYSTYIILIIVSSFAHLIRLKSLKNSYASYTHNQYFKNFLAPAFCVTILSCSLVFVFNDLFHGSFFSFLVLFLFTAIVVGILVFIFNINSQERVMLKSFISKYI